jgi:hypothetical protein
VNIVLIVAMAFFGVIAGMQIFTLHTNIPVFVAALLAMFSCVCIYIARAEQQSNARQGEDDD